MRSGWGKLYSPRVPETNFIRHWLTWNGLGWLGSSLVLNCPSWKTGWNWPAGQLHTWTEALTKPNCFQILKICIRIHAINFFFTKFLIQKGSIPFTKKLRTIYHWRSTGLSAHEIFEVPVDGESQIVVGLDEGRSLNKHTFFYIWTT